MPFKVRRLMTIAGLTALLFIIGSLVFARLVDDEYLTIALVGSTNENVNQPESTVTLATSSLNQISAKGYLLAMQNENGFQVLTSESPDQKFYIASISKLMSAIIAYENIDKNTLINITVEDLSHEYPSGFFKEGEVFRRDEMIKSMLIESNNDATWALARSVGQKKFVNLMNTKARSLEMFETEFANPVGLDPKEIADKGNISTPSDLSKLVLYAFNTYPSIFNITRNRTASIQNFGGGFHHIATSTNQLLWNDEFPFRIMGGKTGNTDLALRNLILIYRDLDLPNTVLVSIVLHSTDQFKDSLILANSLVIQ